MAQGDFVSAGKAYQDQHAIVEPLAKHDPGNKRWQRKLARSHRCLGDMYKAKGQFDEAIAAYRVFHSVAKRLAEEEPVNPEWQHSLSTSHMRLSDALAAKGILPEAVEHLEAALVVGKRLVTLLRGCEHEQWQHRLSVACEILGNIYQTNGYFGFSKLTQAQQAFGAARDILRELIARNPPRHLWRFRLSVVCGKLSEALEVQGRPAEALEAFDESLSIVRKLVDSDCSNSNYLGALKLAEGRIAELVAPLIKMKQAGVTLEKKIKSILEKYDAHT